MDTKNFELNRNQEDAFEFEFEFDFAMCHGSYGSYGSYGYRCIRDKPNR